MKIVLHNIGKVGVAEISLNGLSVVAGPNGSGKSTISRALTVYATTLRRMDELIRDERVGKFSLSLGRILGFSEMWSQRLSLRLSRTVDIDHVLVRSNWDTVGKIRGFLRSFGGLFPASHPFVEKLAELEINVDEVLAALNEAVSFDEDVLAHSILAVAFRNAFAGQVLPLAGASEEMSSIEIFADSEGKKRLGAVWFGNDGKLAHHEGASNLHVPPVIYIEPIHVLDIDPPGANDAWSSFDADRYGASDYSVKSILRNTSYIDGTDDLSQEEAKKEIIESLKTIVHGGFEESDERVMFQEKFSEKLSGFVDLENIASGSKTISVLVHALRNGSVKRGSILVIDEPESNLHPDWQVKFARSLVCLQKRFDLNLLLNTHSPYFLKAIEYYASEERLSSVHYYLMQTSGTDGLYTSLDCQDETNLIFDTMYQPFTDIM